MCSFSSAFAQEKLAKVIWLKGSVHAQNHLLKVGDELQEKSIVTTDAKSLVKIQFADGSLISLSPLSTINLSQLDKKDPSLVQLVSGKLRAQVQKETTEFMAFLSKPILPLSV